MQDLMETIIMLLFFGVAFYLQFSAKARKLKEAGRLAPPYSFRPGHSKTLKEYDSSLGVEKEEDKCRAEDIFKESELDIFPSLSIPKDSQAVKEFQEEESVPAPVLRQFDSDNLSAAELEKGIILAVILGPPRARNYPSL